MIAEPNSVVNLPNHKENGIPEESVPEPTAQNGNCLRNGNFKPLRGKRKIREQCENRRNSSSSRRSCKPQNGEVVEAVTLFEVVSMGKRAMQSVVDDWIEAYKKDRDVALLDLINFFIQCSGCQGMVTAEMYQSLQNCDLVQKMTETFDKETGLQYKKFMAYPWILTVTWPVDMDNEDYPLIKPGFYWKKFKANFCEFTEVLIQQSQGSILYDSYLMDTVISLLTGLADSTVRAFRHTSTFAAVKLLTALVNLSLNLDVSKRNLERLYEVERNRTTGKRTNCRLDQLERKKREYEQKPLEIENMMNAIFKGTFLQRYRDVIPDIRAICIEEMGSWMKSYPDMFLNDSYLKYIGWMLYDKQSDVRLKCLQGLQGIYEQKELVSKMDLFTSRFKDRIVSMTLDKDHEVAVQAMKLLMLLSQNCDDALSSEDYDTLYQFVYTAHRPLAVAAGELLYKRLIVQGIEIDETFSKGNGKQESITSQLKTLIIFFLESELHSHVTYLIDSLWDWAMSLLKDWECMTALLLENSDDQEEALSSVQERTLIEIMLTTVREAAEGHPPVGRGGTRKILSTKEKKAQVEDCTKLTEHFTMVLPQLLEKYSVDAEKVVNLLQIPQYFDLQLYDTGYLDKYLDTLLREVKTIVTQHSDVGVLEACSRVYSVLCNEEFSIYNKVDVARAALVDELVNKLSQHLATFLNEGEVPCTEEDDRIHHICSTLRRIAAFHKQASGEGKPGFLPAACGEMIDMTASQSKEVTNRAATLSSQTHRYNSSCRGLKRMLKSDASFPFGLNSAHDLTKWNLYDKMSELFVFEMEHRPLPVQILVPALECSYFSLLWQLASVAKNSSKENLFDLRTRLRLYCHICTCYLSHSNRDLCEKAFMLLCDLLMVISHQGPSGNEAIGILEYLPSMSLQSKMLLFIQEHVFTEEKQETKELTEEEGKKKLAVLHVKRCLLAAYCKLIVYNVVEMTAAAEIYKHYMKAYNDFGDIIKEMLSRTRHNDKIQSAKMLILCLQQLFQKHVENQDHRSRSSSSSTDPFATAFLHIKELARRFSLTFGWDQVKSRESVAMIHKEGIEFAFQGAAEIEGKFLPPNLKFLIILSEFSNKLLKPDKRLVYSYLLRYIPDPALCRGDSWYSVGWYRTSLLASEDEESSAVISLNELLPMSISKTPLKRKLSEGALFKISHTQVANRTSEIHYPAHLPSLALKSRKRIKSHDSDCQEYSSLLGPACLKRKSSSQSAIKEENSEALAEDTDVDVVSADKET